LKSLIGKVDGLILAGDVFDIWIEWNTVIIKSYFNILHIFALLKEAGCRLVYISGNHDFWLDDFLATYIGFEIFDNTFTETINGKKIFVSHGDLFTKNDTRYNIFRKIVRMTFLQKILKLFHPDVTLTLGKIMSRSSRKRPADSTLKIRQEQGLEETAKNYSQDYDLIVFGHSHNPKKIIFEKGIYINCGDWLTNYTYCYLDEDTIELKYRE
jgi:UDP-2,3-diacylglucosamine hydrolase